MKLTTQNKVVLTRQELFNLIERESKVKVSDINFKFNSEENLQEVHFSSEEVQKELQ